MKKTVVIQTDLAQQRIDQFQIGDLNIQFTYDTNDNITSMIFEAPKKNFPTDETILRMVAEINAIWGSVLRSTELITGNANQNAAGLGSKIVQTAPGQIAWIQGTRFTGTAAQLVGNLGLAPTNGNVLTLEIGLVAAGGARNISSIIQTNVTWTQLIQKQIATGNLNTEIWQGIVASSAGTQITVNLNGTTSQTVIDVQEWAGVTQSTPKDQTATNSNAGAVNTDDSGTTAATTKATELWLCCWTNQSNKSNVQEMSAITGGFTLIDGLAQAFWCALGVGYLITTATGAANSQVTTATACAYVGAIVTLKST